MIEKLTPEAWDEVLAVNRSHTNASGRTSDWVEVMNTSTGSVDLVGMSLSDDPSDARKWVFPSGTLLGGGEQAGEVENSLLRFVSPRRVEGISFLIVNEEEASKRYLYMPSQKKTRLVPEGDNDKSFQGTDFTYYDLSPHHVDSDNYEPLTSERYDGHDTWVCTSLPKPGSGSPYGKIVQWIRKDIYVPVKIDFYDEKGKLLKTSRTVNCQKVLIEMHLEYIDLGT